MRAFSVAVFLMGASAVMAVPHSSEGKAVSAKTVVAADVDVGGSAHGGLDVVGSAQVDAAFSSISTKHLRKMREKDDQEDDENEDEEDENDDAAENADDNDNNDDDDNDSDDADNDSDDANTSDHNNEDDYGKEWSETNAAEVGETSDEPNEDDVDSNASYQMSYDAEADEAPGEGAEDHGPAAEQDGSGTEVSAGEQEAENQSKDEGADATLDGGDEAAAGANATVNATAAAAPGAEETLCTITAQGHSPKEMTVKPGSTVAFKVEADGEFGVKQTAAAGSCEPMAGGFASSKAMLKGDSWKYTVPQNATGKMYVYSGPAGKCDPTMLASITVGAGKLVADTKAPSSTAGSSGSTLGLSSGAGSIAPALGSVAAAAVFAARSLF